MAVKQKPAQVRTGRRVTLTRPGSSGKKNTPVVRKKTPEKRKRAASLPWAQVGRRIGSCFSFAFIFSITLVFIAGVSVGLLYSYRALTGSSYFSLKNIEIQGNSRVSSREILEIARIQKGANTLAFSIDAVEDALLQNPWIRQVSVKRVLPDTLIVSLKEREPSFWMLQDGALMYADLRGKVIGPVLSGKPTTLPTLEVDPEARDSLSRLPDLVQSLNGIDPAVKPASISWIHLSAAKTLELYLEDARVRISIGLEEWTPNLRRLSLAMADLQKRGEFSSVSSLTSERTGVWVRKKRT